MAFPFANARPNVCGIKLDVSLSPVGSNIYEPPQILYPAVMAGTLRVNDCFLGLFVARTDDEEVR